MHRKVLISIVLIIFCGLLLSAQGKVVRIEDIKQNPEPLKNEVVVIEGVATQYVEADAKTTAFYYIKGDWGGIIMVRSAFSAPAVGKRYKISGVVDIDSALNEPFITEMNRMETQSVEKVIGASGASSGEGKLKVEEPLLPKKKPGTLILLLAIAAAVVLIILITVLLNLKKRSNLQAYVTPLPQGVPEPEKVIEGSTIKMSAPPPGTLKLIPGKLVVVAGDDTVKDIRFFKMPNTEDVELTFGRSVGSPYSHIQLKPMTVSTSQARILYKNGKYSLTNFSKTNPTKVNGSEVPSDQSVELKNGDRIEMGEVVLEFVKE